jgi:hypothetical protein
MLVPAALCAAIAVAPPASAQSTDTGWHFGAALHGYFPSLTGTSNFPASNGTPSVRLDVGDIIDLDFAFMGTFEARRGAWGMFTDVLYVDLGAGKSGARDFTLGGGALPAGASADVDYDLKGYAWTIAGTYRAAGTPDLIADVLVGARRLDLEQKLDWRLTGDIGGVPLPGRSGATSVERGGWDGIVGVKGRVNLGADRRWFVPYYVDVGAGDADLTWQAMAGLGYSWSWGDVFASWRHLDYDFSSGRPFKDMTLSGPSLSVLFRW